VGHGWVHACRDVLIVCFGQQEHRETTITCADGGGDRNWRRARNPRAGFGDQQRASRAEGHQHVFHAWGVDLVGGAMTPEKSPRSAASSSASPSSPTSCPSSKPLGFNRSGAATSR